jgi:TrpR family transcriptional regulator, trp operon repressor
MTQINEESLNGEENTDAIDEICTLLAKVKDKNLIKEFFSCLFTPSELNDFSNRWHLVKELEAGTTQRVIAKKYGMSLCNITRGSRELKKEDSAFKKMLALLNHK